jgi:uncharacterized repeat protein (TIGR01451 family)
LRAVLRPALLLSGAAASILLALGGLVPGVEGQPGADGAGGVERGPPLVLAMVWPVPGRSDGFDPASVEEVLAGYGEAFAVSATPAQLARLRGDGFVVDPLGPAKARDGAVRPSPQRAPVGPAYYAVELVAPPAQPWLERIDALGGIAEIPALDGTTLVVRLSAARAVDLAAEPFVASVALHRPEKVPPDLRAAAAGDPSSWLNVSILLFDDAAAPRVAGHVEDGGGSVPSGGRSPSLLVVARVQAGDLGRIASHPEVRLVEEVEVPRLANDVAAGLVGVGAARARLGLAGAGQTIAVVDTGLDTGSLATLHDDFDGRVAAHFGYGRPAVGLDPTQSRPWSDPDGHGTHVAGSVLGDGARSSGAVRGMAPDADLVLQSILDPSGGLGGVNVGPANLMADAYAEGARIQTNSWGAECAGSCPYTSFTAAYDSYLFANPDLLVLFAAGNSGKDANRDGVVDPRSMMNPAIAKNVLTVGATESLRTGVPFSSVTGASFGFLAAPLAGDPLADDPDGLAAFSSRGPTADGRVKPDVVAPGTWIRSARSSAAPSDAYWMADSNPAYAWSGGTSMATPIVAGSAALVRERFMLLGEADPSAALLKAALIHHADDLRPGQHGTGAAQELGSAPDHDQGWGRVDVASAVEPPLPTTYDDRQAGLLTGQSAEYRLSVADTGSPLVATLAWTDRPASPGCSDCLVNDLDLVLVGPSGTIYRGNQFTTAIGDKATDAAHVSRPGATASDDRNNVERIQLAPGMPAGAYTLRVHATAVPVGAQPFALLASGGIGTDLSVDVAASDPTPLSGAPYDVTFTVSNNGPGDAGSASLAATLPVAGAYGTPEASQGSCARSGRALTCALGAIADGASATVTLRLTPSGPGTAAHAATVRLTDGGIDPTPANDQETLSVAVVLASADLAVAVADSADPLLVGQPLAFTAAVANGGPEAAPGVTLTATLPPLSAAAPGTPEPSQGSCGRVGSTVTCLLGSLAPGASATVVLPVTPAKAGTLTATAVAAVTGEAADPVAVNNRASQSTVVRAPRADLAVTNADSADPVLAGQALTYTATVANGGPDDAPAATLAYALPAAFSVGGVTSSQGSCTRVATAVTCPLGPLAAGASATVVVAGVPTASGTLAATATAVAGGGAVDPSAANNKATQATAVGAPRTDLAVTQSDSADPVLAGDPLTYTVTVTNHGPDDAPAVTLADALPTQVAFGSATASQGSCARTGTGLSCALGALASGGSAVVEVRGTPKAGGTLSNVAAATSGGGAVDPAPANNRATHTTRALVPQAGLAVTSIDSADPVVAGVSYSYTVRVANGGPDHAPGVTLRQSLPSGATYGTPVASQGSCTRSSATLTCLLGRLDGGAVATVQVEVTPRTAGTFGSVATATVTGGGADPSPGDNRAAQSTVVTRPSADLGVAVAADADPARLGDWVTYTATITNEGPDGTTGATFRQTLPAGAAYGAPSASQGTCTRSSTTLSCNLGPLASEGSATVSIAVKPSARGTATTSATVAIAGVGLDVDPSDNRSTDATAVT